jgi:CHAD domain-containing protein
VIRSVRDLFVAREKKCLEELARSNATAAIAADLQDLLVRLADWPIATYGWKELRRAVRRSYERARESYQKAHDAPKPTRLHRWRKRVKELWFHLRLLRRASPTRMEELAQDFEVLGEFLGDDHDLSMLKSALEERRAAHSQRAAMETLFELINLRREELLDPAFDLGARLFEESPADFAQELDEKRDTHRKRLRKAKKLGEQLGAA